MIGEPHDIIVQNQTWNKVPLIIGSMRNETDAWVPSNLSEIEYKALFDTAMDLQWVALVHPVVLVVIVFVQVVFVQVVFVQVVLDLLLQFHVT